MDRLAKWKRQREPSPQQVEEEDEDDDEEIDHDIMVVESTDLESVLRDSEAVSISSYRTAKRSDDIGNMTREYLKGKLSLSEIAHVIEEAKLKDRDVENEEDSDPSEGELMIAEEGTLVHDEPSDEPGGKRKKKRKMEEAGSSKIGGKRRILKKAKVVKSGAGSESDSETELNEFERKTVEEILKKALEPPIEPEKSLLTLPAGQLHPDKDFYKSWDAPKEFTIRKRKRMNPTLQALIGEAHLRYARGDRDAAIDICYEIIKEQPTYVEPFSTLSMIYESMNENEKSLQYSLIAAFLDPKRCNDWPKLGEMYNNSNLLTHAIYCYTKATLNDPKCIEFHLRRGELLEMAEDYRTALRAYSKIVALKPEDPSLCLTIMKKQASLYYKIGDMENSYDSLNLAFKNYPRHITNIEINLFVEVAIQLKKYLEALQVLVDFAHIELIPPIDLSGESTTERLEKLVTAMNSQKDLRCRLPKSFPVDLMGKLAIILINLEGFTIAEILTDRLQAYPVKEYGDLYLEVGEAYMTKRRLDRALILFQSLVESEAFSNALSWLRYAECHYLQKNYMEAAQAYERVISLAPKYSVAKLNLSFILEKLGRSDDALETLQQDITVEDFDQDLLVKSCDILSKKKRVPELFQTVSMLFTRHSPPQLSLDDCITLLLISNRGRRFDAIKLERKRAGLSYSLLNDLTSNLTKRPASLDAEWTAYTSLYKFLFEMERWDLLSRLSFSALSSRLFSTDNNKEYACEIHTLYPSLFSGFSELLPYHMRLLLRDSKNNFLLNLFGMTVRVSESTRFVRQVLRLMIKLPEDHRIALLSAHISFLNGNYKYALMEYTTIYTLTPNDPLISLMIASSNLHLLCSKSSSCRPQLGVQIMCFLSRYRELRGETQETFYNLGRMYHVMGLYNLAIVAYKKVFDLPYVPVPAQPPEEGLDFEEDCLDLRMEAAYNLAILYRESGNHTLARHYIAQYLVI